MSFMDDIKKEMEAVREEADAKLDKAEAGETEVELISMWVSPAGRGRGVGDALVTEIERWARGAGARALRLAVVPDNPHAIHLYERSAFAATGDLGDLMPDGVRRELIMVKPLPA
jgi:ribosomal protein S18 acetylase RimI-like enzyme